MIIDPDSVKVLIYNQPVDMRRGIDGLSIMVSDELQELPTSGSLYVFYGRSKDKLAGRGAGRPNSSPFRTASCPIKAMGSGQNHWDGYG